MLPHMVSIMARSRSLLWLSLCFLLGTGLCIWLHSPLVLLLRLWIFGRRGRCFGLRLGLGRGLCGGHFELPGNRNFGVSETTCLARLNSVFARTSSFMAAVMRSRSSCFIASSAAGCMTLFIAIYVAYAAKIRRDFHRNMIL